MALAMQGLTTDNQAEIETMIEYMTNTTGERMLCMKPLTLITRANIHATGLLGHVHCTPIYT